jgi:hypothetical protein
MPSPFDTAYADLEFDREMVVAYDADLEVELDLYFAYDPELEVELELVATDAAALPTLVRTAITPEEVARAAIHARRAAATVSLAPETLDDDWFGSFDETKPVGYGDEFDDQPTTTWRRISDWLLRRAA